MNNLIDTFLQRIESIMSRQGRFMVMTDKLLDLVASKDVALATVIGGYYVCQCKICQYCGSVPRCNLDNMRYQGFYKSSTHCYCSNATGALLFCDPCKGGSFTGTCCTI
jgi:hypothetical protein